VRSTLAVDLAGVRLPTPVMIASGCFTSVKELSGLLDLRKVGGIVTRSITAEPDLGAPTPRMAESSSGLLTAIGLQNEGVESLVAELPALTRIGVPLFASVGGTTIEEFSRIAARLVALRAVTALELNLSCPDEHREGRPFASSPTRAAEVVAAVAGISRVAVFAKLPMDGADVVEVARQCVAAGAHGLTLINAVQGIAIDATSSHPKLTPGPGGLSGPAIKPIALLAVYRVAEVLPDTPIIGVGGISTTDDAVEFLLAGASAVQVGTAMFTNPSVPVDIAVGMGRHLVDYGVSSPGGLRALAHQQPVEA